MSKTIQIEVPADKNVEWQEIDGKTVLVMVDEKDNRPVTERIKTFEDACNELGEDHPFVLAYRNTNLRDPEVAEENRDILAYMKLRIITEALNEGWHPKFDKDEYHYYPSFYRGCLSADLGDDVLPYAGANGEASFSHASIGSRLVFPNKDLAEYAGKQFLDIWADFVSLK